MNTWKTESEKEVEALIDGYKPSFEFMDGHQAADVVMARLEQKDFKKVIPYPYKEMNDVLQGIFPTSFIVIGADSGGGKSDLMGDIAINACFEKKRVLYFDFENDDADFTVRQVCKEMTARLGKEFTVADFQMFDIDKDKRSEVLFECIGSVADKTKDVRLYKNDHLPSINDFVEKLEEVEDVDLVCIDHLHYFEYDDSKNTAEQISKIMRELRKITKIKKIPVILVSHLTKRDRKKLPTYSDFHGTSNIAKEAKTCILLNRDDEDVCTMIIDKNREGGKMKNLHYVWDNKCSHIKFTNQHTGNTGF